MLVRDLLSLAEGDVVPLDYAVERPLELLVNGRLRFRGHLVSAGNKKAFVIAGREEQQR
jgi:flagellar motor switch/type III secretory pathway protein FliN